MNWHGPHWPGPIGAAFLILSLGTAEAAHTTIHRKEPAPR